MAPEILSPTAAVVKVCSVTSLLVLVPTLVGAETAAGVLRRLTTAELVVVPETFAPPPAVAAVPSPRLQRRTVMLVEAVP